MEHLDGYIRTAPFQLLGNALWIARGHERIVVACQQQNPTTLEVSCRNLVGNKHRAKQDSWTKNLWTKQEKALRNIRPVRVAHSDQGSGGNAALDTRGLHEVRKLMRPLAPILNIENSLSKTSKESCRSVLGDLTART
jgi:hypothetical protein